MNVIYICDITNTKETIEVFISNIFPRDKNLYTKVSIFILNFLLSSKMYTL